MTIRVYPGPDLSAVSSRTIIAAVVTLVWAVTYGVSVLHPEFKPPPEVSTVMLIIVTWTFAVEAKKRGGDDNGGPTK